MSMFEDVMSCEESIGSDPDYLTQPQIEAWERLINSGHAFTLQGMFGRYARELIEGGYVETGPTEVEIGDPEGDDLDDAHRLGN